MLVNIPQTLYATDNYNLGRYGELELSVGSRQDNPTNVVSPGAAAIALQELNDRSRIQLEDGSTASNPNPAPYIGVGNTLRAGDTLPGLTGVLNYSFGVYEIHPTEPITFTRVNFRTAAPDPVGGTLKVASFNVLNYFSTLDDSGAICGPTGGQDCRGADSAAEFTRQRDKIIAAIVAMDADVVGLIEIENHATDAALIDLVSGLNDSAGAGTYTALITGPIGSDAIKVAFIYKSATVTPEGAYAVLDSSVDPTFNDAKNRPVLAQTFTQNSNGEIVTVAVNHLKSKGSDCDALGDPDTGDGQGNCNLTRTSAATALVNWLATDPTSSGDPDFLIMGDLNAYAMEDPIAAIVGAGYTDLTNSFTGSGAYSYVYYGQKGYLDYALGNPTLTTQVLGVVQWHINSDEPSALDYNDYNQTALYSSNVYRSSDHDPVIVGLALGITPPTVLYEENTIPADGAELTTGPTQIFVEFDQAVKSGDADSADYLGNFLLVEAGINNVFDTLSCERGVATDDVQIVIDSVSYHDTSPFVSTLGINGNIRLPIGKYRLFVCGTTSIQNLDGLHLNGDLEIGFDSTLSFNVIPLTSAEELPDTGFQVGQVTTLPIQPLSKAYSGTDMTLSIPSIGVNMPIVGIPLSGDSWNVKWLGSNAGYLDGSAFPTWSGNTLITGHVWDSLDQPGPFFDVKTLGFGDQIKIEAWGQTYTYEVRETRLVTSTNVNLAMQSEEYDWVTLVTCEYFDAITGDYIYRRIVRAVLVDVR
jgi:LPXTG-site transpeptidase (sortase) family protein